MLKLVLSLVLASVVNQVAVAQTKDAASPDGEARQRAAQRLQFMKQSVAVYELLLGDDSDAAPQGPRAKAMLEAEPLLRWSNINGDDDGTLFLWTAGGRPVAIAQAFSVEKGKVWLHEFQSLSVETFSLQRDGQPVWMPRQAGLEFKPLPDAPVPATTVAQRTAQMHAMSRRFATSDDYGNNGNLWQLRLLSRPVYRYAIPEAETAERAAAEDLIDGAIFASVVGTDPEVLLLLEARRDGSQPTWHYALAPMTSFSLTATLDGKSVWSCPFRGAPFQPQNAFFTIDYRP